jgi:hypothetical protein
MHTASRELHPLKAELSTDVAEGIETVESAAEFWKA